MKKLKCLVVCVLSAICMCFAAVFAGCGNNLEGYVNNSFKYSIEVLTGTVLVTYEFKIETEQSGGYTAYYSLSLIDESGVVRQTVNASRQIFSSASKTISGVASFSNSYDAGNYRVKLASLQLVNDGGGEVTVTKPIVVNGYAVGFGVAAAVVLCAMVTVFALDKTGKLKKANKKQPSEDNEIK